MNNIASRLALLDEPAKIGAPAVNSEIRQSKDELEPSMAERAFRHVMGHFASGVTIITTEVDGSLMGTTASAFTSVSSEPPLLLVCLNKSSRTGEGVYTRGRFVVNLLARHHEDLALRFASKNEDNRFATGEFDSASEGSGPILADAIAHFSCETVSVIEAGTHRVFVARALSGSAVPGEPLAYYRGSFGGLHGIEAARDHRLDWGL